MNLIFMRHGESMDNIKQILSSNNLACSFLTERGIEQVKTAVDKIKKIDKVYYSPLIRTIQTACLFKKVHHDVEFVIDERIREINYGIYGDKKNNIDLDNVRELQKKGDFFVRFGKYGENKFEIYQRLINFLEDVKNDNFDNNNILIISHGSIISFLTKILGVKSTHLAKGEFQIVRNIDFSNINSIKISQYDIVKKEIKQRLDWLELVKQYPPLLKSIAELNYNDINFNRQVFRDLCLGFTDKLHLITSNLTEHNEPLIFNPICVCIFRNFNNFLKKWTSHYTSLGINKFAMVSCGNEADELNRIKIYFEKEQNMKIDLWLWEGDFNCNKECSIKQRIADYYGKNNWFLFVDSDELFIYPNYRKNKIQEYLKNLEDKSRFITKSIMMDVYPKGKIIDTNDINEWKYIDKDGYKIDSSEKNFPRFYGGMRSRVFKINPSIQKISLFKYSGNELIANDHFLFPYNLNNVPLEHILLHYKFQPGFMKYYEILVKEGRHWDSASEYQKYLTTIKKNRSLSFYDKDISQEISDIDIFKIIQ